MLEPDDNCEDIEDAAWSIAQAFLLIPAIVCAVLAWMYFA